MVRYKSTEKEKEENLNQGKNYQLIANKINEIVVHINQQCIRMKQNQTKNRTRIDSRFLRQIKKIQFQHK